MGDAVQEWRETRRYLREHRQQLTAEAAVLYPRLPRIDGSVLLTAENWLPAQPIPLADATLHWRPDEPPPAASLPGTYAEAVRTIDPPRLFADRPTYRLVDADLTGPGATLAFAMGTFFDVLNVGEAVAHEYADRHRRGRPALTVDDLPLRDRIGDPTDPGRRPMLTAITTLTLRHDRGRAGTRFLAHWRDPAKVATNANLYQVTPVGVFQPAGSGDDRPRLDLDLWRCMAREYSEELLGAAEHEDVEYDRWPFFRQLGAARAAGDCRPYLLGIGIDPLTFATDILTVTVFEAAAFDRIFAGLVPANDEGHLVVRGGDGLFGTAFDPQSADHRAMRDRMQAAGAVLLDLAWSHRSVLLGQ